MKWKEKLVPSNVTRDSVMQISISLIQKRHFAEYKYKVYRNMTNTSPSEVMIFEISFSFFTGALC